MDRTPSQPHPPPKRPFFESHPPFQPPTAQPPTQIPFSDPFRPAKDPFLPAASGRRGSSGPQARVWPSSQDRGDDAALQPLPPPPPPPPPLPSFHPHTHPPNGISPMSLPYDASRRQSAGAGSPTQYPQGPRESPLPPPTFQSRHMPPPSPPQLPPVGAPRGPPTASPFAGTHDLASYSSRPSGGMSISSILGANEERKPHSSPQPHTTTTSTPRFIQPPSPGRARSSSMREGYSRGFRDLSPPRNLFAEARPASSAMGHERTTSEQPRKADIFGSQQLHRDPSHVLRPYQPPQQGLHNGANERPAPARPSSQPAEPAAAALRSVDDMNRRDVPPGSTLTNFRHYEEPRRNIATPRHEAFHFANGHGPTSQPVDRGTFSSPTMRREHQRENPLQHHNGHNGLYGTSMREDQAGLFRPAFGPVQEAARESIESRPFQDPRSEMPRSSPPLSDVAPFERAHNGYHDRPVTWEEHQRMESTGRGQEQRKESDGSVHRSLLNISPELNRIGRNSPLPQAVQGAQPRHVGPGGNNPGIKMEFGRMFSGLGSGVGSATPTAGQSVNGATTPTRLSPVRHIEGGDLVRTAVAEIEDGRNTKGSARVGRKNGRRSREDEEKVNGIARDTPEPQRGAKRSKTAHHHHHVHPHHHHHHHHEPADHGPGPFNTLKFTPNPLTHVHSTSNPSHHHHHHHAHPGHHHHHAPRPAPQARKPTTTVMSRRLVEECASKPRKHLGSQLYTTELSSAPVADTPLESRTKVSSKMKPIPVFEGRENCTYTVRVPRQYITIHGETEDASHFEEVCRRRQLWGTDVYTDDTDVVAAAVHSGWIKGDFGPYNADLHDICENDSEQEDKQESPTTLAIRPRKPVKAPPNHDAHITLLILPPLDGYVSTNHHHIWSREWAKTHDGMSFMIHRIDFVDEGVGVRHLERGASARKKRMAAEEAKRREAAAGLLMFAAGTGTVSVGA